MPPLLIPQTVAIQVPVRRPGVVAKTWAARAVTGPIGTAMLAWPIIATHTPLSGKPALGVCLAAGTAAAVGNARRRRSRHNERMRAYRMSRGELGTRYPIPAPLPSEEGVFRLGVTTDAGPRGDFELRWQPWDGDPPHILYAGATGSGKTDGGRLLIASALTWGWDVEIIDLKGSTEYHPLPIHDTINAARSCLARALRDIRERGAVLRDTPREVVGPDGRVYDGRPRTFRQVPEGDRVGLRIRLILIDEAALLRLGNGSTTQERKAGDEAVRHLQAVTALGRSLGVHLAILVQRPDADLLPGFLKNNVQARVLFGPSDPEAQRMVIGAAATTQQVLESDPTDRPPGRCLAADVGGPGARLAHGYLLHEAALLRPRDAAGTSSSPAEAGESVGAAASSRPPAVPAPSSPRSSGGSADRGYLPASLAPSIRDSVSSGGSPGRSAAPAASPPASPGSSGSVRARGPFVRAFLRLAAWRLVVVPRRPNPPPRPSGLRSRVLASRRHRCAACGATDVQLHVEHWRPRAWGGSDRMRNLWLACTRCHAAKTNEEALVARVQARVRPRALIARVPAWAWVLALVFAAGAVGVGGTVGVLVAAGAVIQSWWVFANRSGLDGVWTSDARLEALYGWPLGPAAKARTATIAGANAVRLVVAALGVAYLAGVGVAWWW